MPAVVLHKGVIRPQVHGHGRAADRAAGDQPGRDSHPGDSAFRQLQRALRADHKTLRFDHLANDLSVVVGLLVAWPRALPQAVIPLGVKQPLLVKAGFLEAVVHVGGQNKIVLSLHQLEKILINRFGRVHVAVDINIPAPIGPVFLHTVKGIEPAGIHIGKVILGDEVAEIFLKALAGIGKPCGSGKAGTGPNHYCICRVQFLFEPGDVIAAGACRFHSRCL